MFYVDGYNYPIITGLDSISGITYKTATIIKALLSFSDKII
jgi:hypothetical protein